MNIKSAIIATAVQVLATNTDIIRKETPTDNIINSLFGIESEQKRFERKMTEVVDKTTFAVSRMIVSRKSKTLVKN